MPPASASVAIEASPTTGRLSVKWLMPAIDTIHNTTPTPMRALSLALVGCRKSQVASINMMTGRAKDNLPKNPATV